MHATRIPTLSIVRNIAFAVTAAVFVAFAVAVLFGILQDVRLTAWSGVAGGLLFAVIFCVSAIAGQRGNLVLWDETVQADYARSQQWAYNIAILVIFPAVAFAIFGGLDPLRGFVASALLVGAVQLMLFSIFELMGR